MLLHYLLTHAKLRSINHKTISEFWNVLIILLNTMMTVLVYCCCSKKLPQDCWLKGTIFFSYCSVDKKFRLWGVKINMSAELIPLESPLENLFLASSSFHWLMTFLGCVPITLASIDLYSTSSSIVKSLCIPLLRILVIIFSSHPDNSWWSLHLKTHHLFPPAKCVLSFNTGRCSRK